MKGRSFSGYERHPLDEVFALNAERVATHRANQRSGGPISPLGVICFGEMELERRLLFPGRASPSVHAKSVPTRRTPRSLPI